MTPERSGPDSGARRREATDLYATVLEVVKRYHGGARITRVSYGAGMPVDRLRILMDRLLSLGLLESEEVDGRPVFDVTARGQEFLDTYWKMNGYLTTLELYDHPGERVSGSSKRGETPRRTDPIARNVEPALPALRDPPPLPAMATGPKPETRRRRNRSGR
ncbi:MAG TPA: winged helix-turn-helix domain-containing protein [Thermoplasmata archaeon]|nr:winged helix-turn-helix domain-containing protein [Thermoplasmata archaeon]